MAIYQPPTRRWRIALVAAIAGVVVGIGIGTLVARGGDPDPEQILRSVDSELEAIAGLLEQVVTVEYREAVKAGDVVSETELRGAESGLNRVIMRYSAVRDTVAVIDHKRKDDIALAIDQLHRLIANQEEPDDVESKAKDLARLLRGAIGG